MGCGCKQKENQVSSNVVKEDVKASVKKTIEKYYNVGDKKKTS
jgi:hypothetical protein